MANTNSITLADAISKGSKAFQRANAHLLVGDVSLAWTSSLPVQATQVTAKRIRQHQGDGMNKWEREWRERITPFYEHIHREVSLPLANGLRFKIDFLCVDRFGAVFGHEVKGRCLPAGIAKLKMAATIYPWISFRMAGKVDGEWVTEDVKP